MKQNCFQITTKRVRPQHDEVETRWSTQQSAEDECHVNLLHSKPLKEKEEVSKWFSRSPSLPVIGKFGTAMLGIYCFVLLFNCRRLIIPWRWT